MMCLWDADINKSPLFNLKDTGRLVGTRYPCSYTRIAIHVTVVLSLVSRKVTLWEDYFMAALINELWDNACLEVLSWWKSQMWVCFLWEISRRRWNRICFNQNTAGKWCCHTVQKQKINYSSKSLGITFLRTFHFVSQYSFNFPASAPIPSLLLERIIKGDLPGPLCT